MKKLLVFVLIAFGLGACKKDPVSWDIDGLVPLMHSRVSLQQAVDDSLISVGPNNELSLVFNGGLFDFTLDSVFSIPDTTTTDQFFLPIGSITLQPGQTFLADTNYTRYDLGGAQITQLKIKSGTISIRLQSSLQGPSVMEYSIPTATKNGVPFFVSENIPAGTNSSPSVITKSYDISGYEFSLTGVNNNDFNIISTAYRVYIDSLGTPVTVTSGDKFVISNTLESITPNYARGYFGSKLLSESSQNEEIDAFENILGGTIDLSEARVNLSIQNEIGVDVGVKINSLSGLNTTNNTTVILQGPITQKTVNLNRAAETGIASSPVNATTYNEFMDPSNSNITEFISNLPNQIGYDLDININPLGNVSNSNDFIYNNSGLRIALDAEIPFKFSSTNLIIADTADFKIDSTSQADAQKITGGFINIYTENWYPFSLDAQFYMLDSNQQVIDSLFAAPQIMMAGIPDPDKVKEPQTSLLQAPLTPAKIDALYRTKFMYSTFKVNTQQNDTIQIYANYFVDINIVGDLTYLISID